MSTVFRVKKDANFTIMANYHLKDRRLSYKAKGLMSEILSLPPDWDYTLTGLAVIANDGINSVRSAVRELEQYGYLVRHQTRDERGRMSVNEYIVYENPEENPEYCPAEKETAPQKTEQSSKAENSMVKPFSPSCDFPSTENPSAENQTTATIYKLNTQELNTKKSNHSINRADAQDDRIDLIDCDCSDNPIFSFSELKQTRSGYRDLIRQNIEYDYIENSKRPKVDELVEIMLDVICMQNPYLRVNSGDMPAREVKSRFLELNYEHIDYVLDALERSAPDIHNIRAYLITALYNAPVTIDNYYSALANHDMLV